MQAVTQTGSNAGCHTDTLYCRLSHRHAIFQAVTQTSSLHSLLQTVKQTPSLSGCHTDTLYCRLSHRLGLLQAVTQTRSLADCQTDTIYCRVSKRHGLLQAVTKKKKKKKKKNSITWKLTHVKVRMGRISQSLQIVTATLANRTSLRADVTLHRRPTCYCVIVPILPRGRWPALLWYIKSYSPLT